MPLEFQAEPAESLIARFPKALEKTWNADEMMADREADRPGLHRAHVFDWPDGIRAIISVDTSAETGPVLHFSFSIHAEIARSAGMDNAKAQARLKAIPVELLGFEPTIAHIQTTERTIHLVCPWPQAPPGK